MSGHKIVPIKHYFFNFAALTVLMLLTVGIAEVDLGSGTTNFVVAVAIAVTKAVLIVLVFMDVRNSSHLTWIFAGAGFAWLVILLMFTLVDLNDATHALGTANGIALPGR